MDLTRSLDGYCERLGPETWAEPINALTNLAFLLAAGIMWRRAAGVPLARLLCVILAVIGLGSGLFHTFATLWAMFADVIPIAVFILVYIYAANRAYWGLRPLWAGIATAGFLPYAMLTTPLFQTLPFFTISASYWPVPLMIAGYALALRRRLPPVSRGLAIGAGLLTVSLTARSLDITLCSSWPLGTHFLWHVLNGLMLGWMIEVLCRHHRTLPPAGNAEPVQGR